MGVSLNLIVFHNENKNKEYVNFRNQLKPRIEYEGITKKEKKILAGRHDEILKIVHQGVEDYINCDDLCFDDDNFPARKELSGNYYISDENYFGDEDGSFYISIMTAFTWFFNNKEYDYLGLEVGLTLESINGSIELDGINSSVIIDLEHEPPDNTITITSEDGNFTAEILSDWNEVTDYSLNEEADLQASNGLSHFMLFAVSKNGLPEYTFEKWIKSEFANLVSFMKLFTFGRGDESKLDINGRAAIQRTLSGVYDDARYKYLLTYIDGKNYYGHIICQSPESDYENCLQAFHFISNSIKGL